MCLREAVESFYSRRLYRDLAQRRQGVGFPFILLLTVLTIALAILGFFLLGAYGFVELALQKLPSFVETLPALTFHQGEMTIDRPSPYLVPVGTDLGAPKILFDTRSPQPSLSVLEQTMRDGKVVCVITAEQLITRQQNGLKVVDMRPGRDFAITHDDWRAYAVQAQKWGVPGAIVFFTVVLFPFLLIWNFAAVAIDAVFVKLAACILRAPVNFAGGMRMAAAFRIPIILIGFLLLFIIGSRTTLAQWLLWLGYLLFAVNSAKQPERVGE